jgi:aspartyl-tRNA(Asn)/glutamyl-tRNA(Gln) amidotransferase subunit C
MPAAFTREDVAAIAVLAQLELAPEELELFARQLGDILSYVDEIQQVDTGGVLPTASVLTRHSSDRSDLNRPSLDNKTATASAPDAVAGLFRVPRIIG